MCTGLTLLKKVFLILVIFNLLNISRSIRVEQNDKDLPYINREEEIDRRRRPSSGSSSGCNFYNKRKPIYKTDGSGRTFLDLAFVNVGYNYDYNVNCGGGGGGHYPVNNPDIDQYHKPGGGHHKPEFGGGHKPPPLPPPHGGHHKPGFGHKPGAGQPGSGGFPNRPFLSMLFANRPLQNLFGQSENQQQQQQPNQPGVINNIATSISGIFPSPQEFGQGLGDGISSFFQTIPQIGQSFQALLPNFDNFQWPQFGGGGQNAQNIPVVPAVQNSPVTPSVPIDEIKPVHEEHDPITDPYKVRYRYGLFTRPGQYVVASHPLLGSSAFHLSSFNPIKFYQGLSEEVEDFLDDIF